MTQNELQESFIDKGVEFYKNNTVGYYDLAMRAGKTRVTIELLKRMFDYDCTILLAYPDNKLLINWQEELVKWKYNNPNITFVNFSSLHKYAHVEFDVFICDEFHSLSDNELLFAQIVSENGITVCLSGTVSKETKDRWWMKEIAQYSTDQGIEDGILADYTITVHVIELDTKVKTKNSKGVFKTEKQRYDAYTWVINNKGQNMTLSLARNRLSQNSIGKNNYLKKLLKQLVDKRVLVFTGLAKAAESLDIAFYHSKCKDDTVFTDFKKGKINQLALAAIGKVGITYPNLDSVILSNFTYNASETAQILNRAIKLDYNNKIADLHIIVLNEKPELKKVKESLNMLNKDKIIWK